jgi:hypothetical protein
MQELLWRVGFLIFRLFDQKFGFKSKLLFTSTLPSMDVSSSKEELGFH